MKKISSNFYKEEGKINTRTVPIPFRDETYHVTLKDDLTSKEKAELFKYIIGILIEKSEEKDQQSLSAVVMTMGILKFVTDIGFPETTEEQLDQFFALMDSGLGQKVFEAFREGLAEELLLFVKTSAGRIGKEDVSTLTTQFQK